MKLLIKINNYIKMLSKEMLEGLFNKQLKDKLEFLEKRNSNESTCLTLLSTNMKTIESIYYFIILFI